MKRFREGFVVGTAFVVALFALCTIAAVIRSPTHDESTHTFRFSVTGTGSTWTNANGEVWIELKLKPE